MTTAAPTRPALRGRLATGALTRTTLVEAKLYLRDPGSIFVLIFPAGLLLGLGWVMPGFREPTEELGGLRVVDVYVPVVVAVGLATAALLALPSILTSYRERGMLRRLATTPARPSVILSAQLLVNLAATLVAVVLAVAAGALAFAVDLPGNLVGSAAAVVLGTAAMFGLGLLIAAVTPTARVASGIGSLTYFPMMFFAGVWLPGPAMPETLRRISELTPLGAAAQAFQNTWDGDWPSLLQVAVMLVWFLVAGALAARLFRWE